MALSKWCELCHAGYRGLFILHTATKGHQRKLQPTPGRGKSARDMAPRNQYVTPFRRS